MCGWILGLPSSQISSMPDLAHTETWPLCLGCLYLLQMWKVYLVHINNVKYAKGIYTRTQGPSPSRLLASRYKAQRDLCTARTAWFCEEANVSGCVLFRSPLKAAGALIFSSVALHCNNWILFGCFKPPSFNAVQAAQTPTMPVAHFWMPKSRRDL